MQRPVFLIFLLFFFVSCATPPFRTDKPRIIPEDFFGISPHRRILTPDDYPLIDGLGTVWQRRTCRWSALEFLPGKWNFIDWDYYVENAKNADKKLLAILAYTNPLYYKGKKNPKRII